MVEHPELWYATAHFKLREAHRRSGRRQEARCEHQIAIRLKPEYHQAFNALGETYLAEGKSEQAMEFLERAAALCNNHPPIHLNFGRALLSRNKHADASAEFARTVKSDPDSPEVHCFLGKICVGKGQCRKAICHL